MPRILGDLRTVGPGRGRAQGLLANQPARRLTSRSAQLGTPGLIAPGPGLCLPRLEERHSQFSPHGALADGAEFAANLLRAEVAHPDDWESTRKIGEFLQRTVERLVGDRAASIDYAFDVSLCLGTTASSWRTPEEIDPRRVLLSFRVAHTVAWVNVMPALELLKSEQVSLPGVFYHGLRDSLSRWFCVFDVHEARWRWESWIEMREKTKPTAGNSASARECRMSRTHLWSRLSCSNVYASVGRFRMRRR